MKELHELRENYMKGQLELSDVDMEPINQFKRWFDQAQRSDIHEPNAMTLSTVSKNHSPNSRVVLLKEISANGFVFYTNYTSDKAKDIAHNNNVCLSFLWTELERQVRISGVATKLSREKSMLYYNSRPRGSQIGAWVSPQSEQIESRSILDERLKHYEEKFKDQDLIPIPEHWGGYEVIPSSIEFWQGRPNRLHDRIKYTLSPEGIWQINRLAP